MSPEEAMGLAGPPQALPPEAGPQQGQQQGSPQAALALMQQALMAGG